MGNGDGADPVTLVVGTGVGVEAAVRVPVALLDAGLMARLSPARVVCALFSGECDAVMVAERLAGLGWRGELVVLAPDLPDRRMVEREVQAAAPLLRVRLVAAV